MRKLNKAKKNLRIIQINGFRGLCAAVGIVVCLIAGFVAFPGLVMMKGWNLLAEYVTIPTISLIQGVLLWGISVVSYMILTKNRVLVAYRHADELSQEEMNAVMQKIQYETTRKMMSDVMEQALKEQQELAAEIKNVESVILDQEVEKEKETLEN